MFRPTPILRLHLPNHHILEVERKFGPTPLSISLLTQNSGLPAFPRHVARPSLVFEDTYFDRNDVLSKQGVYVRRRRYLDARKPAKGQGEGEKLEKLNKLDHWEAKVRISGDFTRSAFQELHGFDAVARVVRERFPNFLQHQYQHRHDHDHHHHPQHHSQALASKAVAEDKEGEGKLDFPFLDVLARFITHRRQWLINERFHVVLDEADFGHIVGEVELAHESTRSGAEGKGQAEVGEDKDLAKKLDAEISSFMSQHRWAFQQGEGEVQGKLSAYFAWKKRAEGGA